MLQFRCPHCSEVLRIHARHLGQTGGCKKCGGRIALIGHENPDVVQTASRVDDGAGVRDQRPASEAQKDHLRNLGVPEARVLNALRHDVSTIIQQVRSESPGVDVPTEAQLNLLRRLGVTEDECALIRTKADASHLIEGLQPKPTDAQLQYLKRLGVSTGQLEKIATRSEAGELIEHLLRRP